MVSRGSKSPLKQRRITSSIAIYIAQMGTGPILAMPLAMQLALNIGKHQRKTSQTRRQMHGMYGPFYF